MHKQIEQVREFHNSFGHPVLDVPMIPTIKRIILRRDLLIEENNELFGAAMKGDIVEVADAITDCFYVLVGTALEYGMQNVLESLFDEVHRSNMSKLGADGKPITREDGKTLKGPNYTPPNIQGILF
jgi:predicted HAD superfamily Cof-like phosphohydrolase